MAEEKAKPSEPVALQQDEEAKTRGKVTCDRCKAEFAKPTYVEDTMTCPNCGMQTSTSAKAQEG